MTKYHLEIMFWLGYSTNCRELYVNFEFRDVDINIFRSEKTKLTVVHFLCLHSDSLTLTGWAQFTFKERRTLTPCHTDLHRPTEMRQSDWRRQHMCRQCSKLSFFYPVLHSFNHQNWKNLPLLRFAHFRIYYINFGKNAEISMFAARSHLDSWSHRCNLSDQSLFDIHSTFSFAAKFDAAKYLYSATVFQNFSFFAQNFPTFI